MFDHEPGTVERARKLRRAMSLPEVLLWQRLRRKPLGLRFRSQHPIQSFVVDFYCHKARTVIEIDGIAHDMGDQPEFDQHRDNLFKAAGLTVLRIPAIDVLLDPDSIAEGVVKMCVSTPPPPGFRPTIGAPA